jgi:hypothetical protein
MEREMAMTATMDGKTWTREVEETVLLAVEAWLHIHAVSCTDAIFTRRTVFITYPMQQ